MVVSLLSADWRPPMPSRPSPHALSSRDRLLQAGKKLFAAQGYEQTATSAIAREAGTSESQLMRYFGGKVGLLQALFDAAWTDLNERVRRVVETTGTSREMILTVLQTVTNALARDPDLAALFLFEGRRLRTGDPRVQLSPGLLSFSEMLRGLVRKGQAAREIDRSLDATAITSSIVGATEAMIRDRLLAKVSGSRGFAEREIQRTLDAMLRGFSYVA